MSRTRMLALALLLTGCGDDVTDPPSPRNPEIVDIWGTPADDPGQFVQATAIGLDGDRNIYVADAGLARIQKLDAAGTPLEVWPLPVIPTSLDVTETGEVVVSSYRVGSTDAQLLYLDSTGSVEWQQPILDAEGTVFAADVAVRDVIAVLARSKVQIFTKAGDFVRAWRAPGINSIDMPRDGIVAFMTPDGREEYHLDGTVADIDRFEACFTPFGDTTDTDADGVTYYYTDSCPSDPARELRVVGASGGLMAVVPLELDQQVKGIEVDDDGGIFVAPRDSREILKGTLVELRLVEEWRIGGRRGPGDFDRPLALDVSASGRVAVVEKGGRRVQVFAPDGSVESSIQLDLEPRDVAFDSQGRILVAAPRGAFRYVGSELDREFHYDLGPHALASWVAELDGVVYLGFDGAVMAEDAEEPVIDTDSAGLVITDMTTTPDGEFLLVARPIDGDASRLLRYSEAGTLLHSTELEVGGVRALAVDPRGNVYVSSDAGIWELELDGTVVREIDVPDLPVLTSLGIASGVLSGLDPARELVYRVRIH